uniref:U2 small nuclear ribonucleoprotein auxiliary factor 35 kDa subunit-related protein 1, putative isoform 1 n=1 Tax=Tanacetum cinerariifolium TaxID=118510 RepID=A0A6L2J2J4_TANCI|nr:U2 small nuclear ribonucleoprotein auxiliary factor 35 kDa subunit-related protein 1, putative isoform 1 [Tanacetum cinerariifolium]
MELNDFEALFGEAKVETSAGVSRTLLFEVHAPNKSEVRVDATDFMSMTFGAVRSVQQLDDMRDETGIGGSWSEFLEYLVNSIKFGDVKLVLEGQSTSDGPASARLIAHKAKGMPRISISMARLSGSAAKEAMARLSLDMFKTYKSNHKLLVEEQEGRHQFTKMLSAEQEKSKNLQKQLDALLYSKRHKSQNIHDNLASENSSVTTLHDAPDKQSDQNPSPMKATKRVVPAHRRSKVRGALLQDTEDD